MTYRRLLCSHETEKESDMHSVSFPRTLPAALDTEPEVHLETH
jgi:hypothetical protein